MKDFIVLDSFYGKFIINRHNPQHAECLITTNKTNNESELATMRAILDTLPEDLVFVDVGANLGMISIPIAQYIKGRVVAFEVQTPIHNALCGSIALNGISNIFVHKKAVSDINGTLYVPKIDYSVRGFDYGTVSIEDNGIEDYSLLSHSMVESVRLDDCDLPGIDFLKIDVEGHELRVLDGAKEMVSKYRPYIWVEFSQYTLDEIKSRLDNYKFMQMTSIDLLCCPIEKFEHSGLVYSEVM